MDSTEFVNSFITLLVVSNPLSALPAVLRITRPYSLAEKRKIGLVTAFAVAVIFLISVWIGKSILLLLGIKLPAFQVAGGIVLFMLSLSMLTAEESPIKQTPEEQKEKRPASETGAIVPLAIPIIAGPAAISNLIVTTSQFSGVLNQLLLTISGLLVAFVMAVLLYFAANLEKMLGQSGVNIINRLGGLILTAIAIQTIANGLIGLFPFLASH